MSKGRKNRRDKPKPLTPEQIAARERAIEIGSMVVINREEMLVRLIDTAIRLWFYNGDYLCVHVLASAAYRTLSDYNEQKRIEAMADRNNRTRAIDQCVRLYKTLIARSC